MDEDELMGATDAARKAAESSGCPAAYRVKERLRAVEDERRFVFSSSLFFLPLSSFSLWLTLLSPSFTLSFTDVANSLLKLFFSRRPRILPPSLLPLSSTLLFLDLNCSSPLPPTPSQHPPLLWPGSTSFPRLTEQAQPTPTRRTRRWNTTSSPLTLSPTLASSPPTPTSSSSPPLNRRKPPPMEPPSTLSTSTNPSRSLRSSRTRSTSLLPRPAAALPPLVLRSLPPRSSQQPTGRDPRPPRVEVQERTNFSLFLPSTDELEVESRERFGSPRRRSTSFSDSRRVRGDVEMSFPLPTFLLLDLLILFFFLFPARRFASLVLSFDLVSHSLPYRTYINSACSPSSSKYSIGSRLVASFPCLPVSSRFIIAYTSRSSFVESSVAICCTTFATLYLVHYVYTSTYQAVHLHSLASSRKLSRTERRGCWTHVASAQPVQA